MEYQTKRLIVISLVMLIIWGSLITFWYLKADEITRDPCSICAMRQGKDIICYAGINTKTFYSNGTTILDTPGYNNNLSYLNLP